MLKENDLIAKCLHCNMIMKPVFTGKMINDDLQEVGITCQSCGKWHVVYWLNQELRDMQIKDANRRTQRAYKKKFEKLQKERLRAKGKV